MEGVSLERINPNTFSPGSINWQSASKQSGYGTPGYKNSQYNITTQIPQGNFILSSNRLSPDSDGFEDLVQISYSLSSPGYTLNMEIYDSSGRKIKRIADNELLGSEGSFKWDGTTDENTKAGLGIYIVFIEYFNLTGTVLQQKLPVVVAGKIN